MLSSMGTPSHAMVHNAEPWKTLKSRGPPSFSTRACSSCACSDRASEKASTTAWHRSATRGMYSIWHMWLDQLGRVMGGRAPSKHCGTCSCRSGSGFPATAGYARHNLNTPLTSTGCCKWLAACSTPARSTTTGMPKHALGAMLRPSPGECTRSTSGMLSRSGTTSAEEQLSSNCRRSMPKAETRARCQLLYPVKSAPRMLNMLARIASGPFFAASFHCCSCETRWARSSELSEPHRGWKASSLTNRKSRKRWEMNACHDSECPAKGMLSVMKS
mmetsp:Transcript_336/g.805  ORF Transcript_336/g.805 Transcript_336/m.805 type:complete len:274 (+) Transcript_336:673-1494(+)